MEYARMRGTAWLPALVALTGMVSSAAAQPGPLAPTGGPPQTQPSAPLESTSTGQLPPEPPSEPESVRTAPVGKVPNLLGPPVLGAPVRAADREPLPAAPSTPANPAVIPAGAFAPVSSSVVTGARRATLGAPVAAGAPIAASKVETSTRTMYTPSDNEDPVNELLQQRSPKRSGDRTRGRKGDDLVSAEPGVPERSAGKFGDKITEAVEGVVGGGRDWFKSDHAFDGFISPVTNPMLFEDPRSLTEVRPIFMYQQIPSAQPDFKGGNVWYYGTQIRLAVTERLSFTMNKLGGVTLDPGSGSTYGNETGFAELWLGPKYTFLRNENSGSVAAAGIQFQIPLGSANVFQNTGDLSLVPYLSYAQSFGREWRYGSFNTVLGAGYSIATDSVRSDYGYLSAHLDFDIMNKHKFYPLVEMNWIYYTSNGKGQPISGEGRDLFNFGGNAANTGLLTAAFGGRYKLSECAQFGAAFEFPLAGPRDMFNYRVTLDFILRY